MDPDNRQDPIFQDILNDPYDLTPKWEPVSVSILNEPMLSVVDIHYFYAMELAKMKYRHKQFKYKTYLLIKNKLS